MAHQRDDRFPWETLVSLPSVRLVGAGIAAAVLAIPLRWVAGDLATFIQVVLFVSGLLLAGGGVWWQLRNAGMTFEDRARSALVVAGADAAVLAAYVAMNSEWDSMRMVLVVLWVVGLLSVPLLLLPSVGRRIAISLLLVLHFGGILTATTAVGLSNNTSPWVPTTLWTYYRPYLTFMYLNNAYHFYSPEPGPPTLVWFRVEFEGDVPAKWLKLVNREECATRLQYQRLLALTESVNSHHSATPGKLEQLTYRLKRAVDVTGIKLPAYYDSTNYREPSDRTKRLLASYVRHVARRVRSDEQPEARIKGIKVYRVTHRLINAPELAGGLSPIDPVMYIPYFQGEYNPDGTLKGPKVATRDLEWREQMPDGTWKKMTEKAQDPFLYWLLPIWREPQVQNPDPNNPTDWILFDELSKHAGSPSGLETPKE